MNLVYQLYIIYKIGAHSTTKVKGSPKNAHRKTLRLRLHPYKVEEPLEVLKIIKWLRDDEYR